MTGGKDPLALSLDELRGEMFYHIGIAQIGCFRLLQKTWLTHRNLSLCYRLGPERDTPVISNGSNTVQIHLSKKFTPVLT